MLVGNPVERYSSVAGQAGWPCSLAGSFGAAGCPPVGPRAKNYRLAKAKIVDCF